MALWQEEESTVEKHLSHTSAQQLLGSFKHFILLGIQLMSIYA